MRKIDLSVLAPLLLCSAVLGIGCGDDTTTTSKLDSGVMDGAAADTKRLDSGLDAPRPMDTNRADRASDLGVIDAPSPSDAPSVDAPATDAGTGGDASRDSLAGADAQDATLATITFRFRNAGAQAVYLYRACWIPLQVVSAADGEAYTNAIYCACECADPVCLRAVMCAPCAPPDGVAVEPGATLTINWMAGRSTLQSMTGPAGAYQCMAHTAIPTGMYQVTIPVYPSATDAVAKLNGKTVTVSFPLTTANATVEVPLG